MTGTLHHGQAKSTTQSDPTTLEFVSKEELDRAPEEVERLREKPTIAARGRAAPEETGSGRLPRFPGASAKRVHDRMAGNPGRHTASTTAAPFQNPSMSGM
jgi:hypothetical protein